MSGKYVFSQALKEVRFLFCQTGEHSGATRSVSSFYSLLGYISSRIFPAILLLYESREQQTGSSATRQKKTMKRNRSWLLNTDLSSHAHTQPWRRTTRTSPSCSEKLLAHNPRSLLDMVSLTTPPARVQNNRNHNFVLIDVLEFGKEKSESLLGLSDKQIEEKITSLVKNSTVWRKGDCRESRNVYIWGVGMIQISIVQDVLE